MENLVEFTGTESNVDIPPNENIYTVESAYGQEGFESLLNWYAKQCAWKLHSWNVIRHDLTDQEQYVAVFVRYGSPWS